MLDQMFTAENFRRVYDAENRKGFDVAGEFFPQLEQQTYDVKNKVSEIKLLRGQEASLKPDDFKSQLSKLKRELAELKAGKSSSVDLLLEEVSENVAAPNFKIALTKNVGPKGKDVFCIDGSPETYFAVKQLQRNINRIYGVKQASRHDLACELRDTLGSNYPFEVIRTDISSFYESIDRKRIYEKLDNDRLISSASKRFLKQILDSYAALSGSLSGIPRGVGVSAYLAELYLRPMDKLLNKLPGVVLYCRYVDDIVIVFARPPAGTTFGSFEAMTLDIIQKHGLAHNAGKTFEFDLGVPGLKSFEYLGYKFIIDTHLKIAPSTQKLARLEERLNASFSAYNSTTSVNPRRAYRELVARIKFLTGNTRLSHSKSNAKTGIYYNNSLVNDVTGLAALDSSLKASIKLVKRPSLRARLKGFSFVAGFEERRYHTFSATELQNVVRAWKHV